MIKFSNGHELTFACASGALAFDGRGYFWEQPFRLLGLMDPKAFTVVAKTVTLKPVVGNYKWYKPWTCVRQVNKDGKWGLVNAIGLSNDGLPTWINRDYPMAKQHNYKIAISVKPNNPAEAAIMAGMIVPLDLAYVEVNVSCPNTEEIPTEIPDMLRMLQQSQHPIVLKLSEAQVTKQFVEATEDFVDAYHGINTVPWDDVFPGETSPIEHYPHKQKGGVSGDHIIQRSLACVKNITRWTRKPVIGGGGIFKGEDVLKYHLSGANAFSIGSAFPLTPWRPNRIIKEYERILRRSRGNANPPAYLPEYRNDRLITEDHKRADEYAQPGSVEHLLLRLGYFPNNEQSAEAIVERMAKEVEWFRSKLENCRCE